MFGRANLNILPQYIFKNVEIAQLKRRQLQNFQKWRG